MASAALSSHSLFFSPRLSAFQKSLKSLKFKTPNLQSIRYSKLCKYTSDLGFTSFASSTVSQRSIKSFLRADGSDSSVIDGKEDNQTVEKKSEGETAQKNVSNLKTLIKVYKEAILDGDEKTVSEIEAMIYIIENEKNEYGQKVATLSADIISGKDKYLRLKADFENFRKRSDKERLTLTSDAQEEVISSLLQIVDNFERAKQQIRPETEKEKKIDTSYQGIYKQFVEIMRSKQVAVVPTVGKPFDPSLHEAIAREESQEFKEGIIIQEVRRGFLIGGRLLRPAIVKVSSGPGHKKTSDTAERSTEQPTAAVD
ncbi:protein GrpE [Telopea speciosissima]|uniref:protein GrpE n=1 Tax=Telopea speciosissima TaxID=54955 RepID=UPI001CC6E0C9|nr:protein GrpE [Telopea speciosissima]XP_043707387.1 protein GrpE [Telopea speciosissima]